MKRRAAWAACVLYVITIATWAGFNQAHQPDGDSLGPWWAAAPASILLVPLLFYFVLVPIQFLFVGDFSQEDTSATTAGIVTTVVMWALIAATNLALTAGLLRLLRNLTSGPARDRRGSG